MKTINRLEKIAEDNAKLMQQLLKELKGIEKERQLALAWARK